MSEPVGFDETFLGVDAPMPTLAGTPTVLLPSTHFSVLLRPDRRLAAATAVGIDGARLLDLDRGDDWRLDPRVGADYQTGPEVYADNDLDRGHLVRRRDPVWGSPEEARRANEETFLYTNAAPQHAGFNQDRELWLGLETYLLESAADFDRRIVVLTGPVLDADDPPYRGVRIPLRFWKVAGFLLDGELASTAYVLDQTPFVDTLPRVEGEAPPLGPYRTFQVPVADVAALTGLDLGPFPAADRLLVPATSEQPWRRLGRYADIAL